MNLQAKNQKQYYQAAETLYVLDSVQKYSDGLVSKIALQKIMYLSVVLSPIKDIVISFYKYMYNVRGPYNYELQNTVDHLVGLDYVEIVDYSYLDKKQIYVTYRITEKGSKAVKQLIRTSKEEEKYWWIKSVCRLSISYSKEFYTSKQSGLDKIMDYVYQDPLFLKGKQAEHFRMSLEIGSDADVTKELIIFTKEYLDSVALLPPGNERKVSEIILVLFFEHMHSAVISKERNG